MLGRTFEFPSSRRERSDSCSTDLTLSCLPRNFELKQYKPPRRRTIIPNTTRKIKSASLKRCIPWDLFAEIRKGPFEGKWVTMRCDKAWTYIHILLRKCAHRVMKWGGFRNEAFWTRCMKYSGPLRKRSRLILNINTFSKLDKFKVIHVFLQDFGSWYYLRLNLSTLFSILRRICLNLYNLSQVMQEDPDNGTLAKVAYFCICDHNHFHCILSSRLEFDFKNRR